MSVSVRAANEASTTARPVDEMTATVRATDATETDRSDDRETRAAGSRPDGATTEPRPTGRSV